MTQENSSNCGKCGMCLTVCPVFKVLKEEQASPRARIQLIKAFKEKRMPSSPLLKELISKCLMCGSCAALCPSGINHYSQFMEMRSQLIEDQGDRLEIRGLVYLLAREQRLRLAMGMARRGQEIMPEFLQKKYKLGNIAIQKYPQLNKKAFRAAVPEVVEAAGTRKGKVVYFTGCATNYIYDETGFATIELLSRMGYEVHIPAGQTCCSIPMLYHGGVAQAQPNIEKNISCLNHPDAAAVIVDCPTCGSALKHEFPAMMLKYGEDDGAALAIAGKTTDLMSFVYTHLDEYRQLLAARGKGSNTRITYHAPCHLRNSFTSAARVFQAIPEIDYVPTVDCAECCGGGGTFFYEYPEVSGKLAESKIVNARKTGATLWLTDCPVCRINLEGQLSDADTMTMMHPARFLAKLIK